MCVPVAQFCSFGAVLVATRNWQEVLRLQCHGLQCSLQPYTLGFVYQFPLENICISKTETNLNTKNSNKSAEENGLAFSWSNLRAFGMIL